MNVLTGGRRRRHPTEASLLARLLTGAVAVAIGGVVALVVWQALTAVWK